MVRSNVKIFIIFITIVISTLFGCSNIGYNTDNKDKKITIEDRKSNFTSDNGIIQKPIPHINDLTVFLNKYDCSMSSNQDICYEKTRARLIQITKDLDEAEFKIYRLKRSTGVLRTN